MTKSHAACASPERHKTCGVCCVNCFTRLITHVTRLKSHVTRHTSHVTFTFVAAATSSIPYPVACSEVWGLRQRALRRILKPSRWALSGYAEHALLKGVLRSRTHRAAAPAKPGYTTPACYRSAGPARCLAEGQRLGCWFKVARAASPRCTLPCRFRTGRGARLKVMLTALPGRASGSHSELTGRRKRYPGHDF
jgi:hypothetical protein